MKLAALALAACLSAAAAGVANPYTPIASSISQNGFIRSLAVFGTDLVAGGSFGSINGVGATNIAKIPLAGGAWSDFYGGADRLVYSLAPSGDFLHVGGLFSILGFDLPESVSATGVGKYSARQGSAGWEPMDTGSFLAVKAVVAGSSGLYASGGFPGDQYVAKWSGGSSSWVAMGSPSLGSDPQTLLVLSNGDVLAGGMFSSPFPAKVLRFDGTAWQRLGSIDMDDFVLALAEGSGGTIYAGGAFRSIGALSADRVAAWDPLSSTWTAMGQGMNDDVLALAFSNGVLYAGGAFSLAGGLSANLVAMWIGGAWAPLTGALEGASVNALLVHDNTLYIGGDFLKADGVDVGGLVSHEATPPSPSPSPTPSVSPSASASVTPSTSVSPSSSPSVSVTPTVTPPPCALRTRYVQVERPSLFPLEVDELMVLDDKRVNVANKAAVAASSVLGNDRARFGAQYAVDGRVAEPMLVARKVGAWRPATTLGDDAVLTLSFPAPGVRVSELQLHLRGGLTSSQLRARDVEITLNPGACSRSFARARVTIANASEPFVWTLPSTVANVRKIELRRTTAVAISNLAVMGYPLDASGPARYTPVDVLALAKATGKVKVRASSQYLGRNLDAFAYPPAKVLDRSAATFWHSTSSDVNPTLTLDLGAEYLVQYVDVASRQDCCAFRGMGSSVRLLDGDMKVQSTARLAPANYVVTGTHTGCAKAAAEGEYPGYWRAALVGGCLL